MSQRAHQSRQSAFAGLAMVVAMLVSASTAYAGAPLDLAALLAAAERGHPELAAAAASVRANHAQIAAARQLPSPTVAVTAMPLPVETRVGPQRFKLSVKQPLPWLGRFDRMAAAASAAERAEIRRKDALLARIRRDVRVPWADLAWIDRVAAIVQQQHDLLVALEPSVLARLRVGKASYEDAQRLRLLIGELDERRRSLLDLRRAVAAEVRAAAGIAPDVALADAAFEPDPLAGRPLPEPATLHAALAENPEVTAAEAQIAAAKSRVDVAKDAKRFDFAVGIDWIAVGEARMPGVADSGTDTVMLTASVQLPVWRKAYDAREASARAQVEAAAATREATLRRAEGRLGRLLFALRDARRKDALYRGDLLPRAQSALQAATTAYASGKASFENLIALQRQLLAFEIRLLDAERARVQALANLEWLLGKPVARPKEETR